MDIAGAVCPDPQIQWLWPVHNGTTVQFEYLKFIQDTVDHVKEKFNRDLIHVVCESHHRYALDHCRTGRRDSPQFQTAVVVAVFSDLARRCCVRLQTEFVSPGKGKLQEAIKELPLLSGQFSKTLFFHGDRK